MFTEAQLRDFGEMFLSLLMTARHKGAVEPPALSFQAMCSALLRAPSKGVGRESGRICGGCAVCFCWPL